VEDMPVVTGPTRTPPLPRGTDSAVRGPPRVGDPTVKVFFTSLAPTEGYGGERLGRRRRPEAPNRIRHLITQADVRHGLFRGE
jgi:hypothetical protein